MRATNFAKGGPTPPSNPDPEAHLRRQEQESEQHLSNPASTTGLSIRWLQLGPLKVPIGLSMGVRVGGRFRPGRRQHLDCPVPEGKQWNSEKGRFE
jgi:hypothetical protein